MTGTLVGERWRIGGTVVLQATSPCIPCATFAHRMGEPRWVKRFTARGATGTYLRVVAPADLRAAPPTSATSRSALRGGQHQLRVSSPGWLLSSKSPIAACG
jgi:MOSC domain-containing protein YiiM